MEMNMLKTRITEEELARLRAIERAAREVDWEAVATVLDDLAISEDDDLAIASIRALAFFLK